MLGCFGAIYEDCTPEEIEESGLPKIAPEDVSILTAVGMDSGPG